MINEVLDSVSTRVTSDMNSQLSLPFTPKEVISALSQMAPLKSPGPDGLLVIFFHKYCHLLGSNIITCVLDFLNMHRLPQALNYTFIVLIPKLSHPKRITEFRPISLCNVVYKLGSEALANRIKPVRNTIISHTQLAFVPGRLITNSVLVAYEVNHFIHYHSYGKRAFIALKLDVSKAYEEEASWKTEIIKYLFGEVPVDKKKTRKMRFKGSKFTLIDGELYKRCFSSPYLKCLGPYKADYVLREIHEGICGNHLGGKALALKALRQGYYWPTIRNDAQDLVKKCKACQSHANVTHLPSTLMHPIESPNPSYSGD